MALAQDIGNKSIREAISTIAQAVDALEVQPQDLSAITGAISELKAAVKDLNVAINGEQPPVPTPTLP